ncbi:hypothetical protein [Cupriavidus basilensis]|nr:hypothetical protein [Cupriavidus basilensis]
MQPATTTLQARAKAGAAAAQTKLAVACYFGTCIKMDMQAATV